jgi:hypothetical protein
MVVVHQQLIVRPGHRARGNHQAFRLIVTGEEVEQSGQVWIGDAGGVVMHFESKRAAHVA